VLREMFDKGALPSLASKTAGEAAASS